MAPEPQTAPVEHVGVDHGRLDVFLTEQLLNRPDIISVLQEVGGEGVAPMPGPA